MLCYRSSLILSCIMTKHAPSNLSSARLPGKPVKSPRHIRPLFSVGKDIHQSVHGGSELPLWLLSRAADGKNRVHCPTAASERRNHSVAGPRVWRGKSRSLLTLMVKKSEKVRIQSEISLLEAKEAAA